MEFISENYIWIIIITIIVIMTIIGYIADKTDFGKQPIKEKKIKEPKVKKEKIKKEKHKKENNDEVLEDNLPEEVIEQIPEFEINKDESLEENVEPAFDTDEMDLGPQFDDDFMNQINSDEVSSTDDELKIEEPVVPEEINITDEDNENSQTSEELFENPMKEEKEQVVESMEEQPVEEEKKDYLDDIPFVPEDNSEEKISDELVGNNNEDLDIELPSIETLNKELADDTEDDDVWKF